MEKKKQKEKNRKDNFLISEILDKQEHQWAY